MGDWGFSSGWGHRGGESAKKVYPPSIRCLNLQPEPVAPALPRLSACFKQMPRPNSGPKTPATPDPHTCCNQMSYNPAVLLKLSS